MADSPMFSGGFLRRAPLSEPPVIRTGEAVPPPPPSQQRDVESRNPLPEPQLDPAELRAVRLFAEQSLRLVLEVLDRRRPPQQLRAVLGRSLIEAVLAASVNPPGRSLGTARLQRVHVRPVDSFAIRSALSRPAVIAPAAEVFGHYARGAGGGRVFAVAGRIGTGKTGLVFDALQIA
ncbi:Rv3235 family protein [Aldersonia sp. NBC_00410]|uniref:Rv3235 family protein n=1 Tax=Aldersonia sp. NBC_00410 TaxID=2975954 RepID=UPI0022522629|nr:Rv3235 family protein [Aldersonia sp. NBC_00410]MCX5046716.1 Rv3235 family protein [Aldersonia sp. NBC_00410]